MKPVFKRLSFGMAALILAMLFLVWDVFKFVAFLLGIAAVPDDFATTKTVAGKFLDWLLSTPWWVPSGLLLIPLGILVYLVWKTANDFTISKEYREQASAAHEYILRVRELGEAAQVRERLEEAVQRVERSWTALEQWQQAPLPVGEMALSIIPGRNRRNVFERWDSALGNLTEAMKPLGVVRAAGVGPIQAVPGERNDVPEDDRFAYRVAYHDHEQAKHAISAALIQASQTQAHLERATGLRIGSQSLPSIEPERQQ